jgi:hypothetical protein
MSNPCKGCPAACKKPASYAGKPWCWQLHQGNPFGFLTEKDCRDIKKYPDAKQDLEGMLLGTDSATANIWLLAKAAGIDIGAYGVLETRCAVYRRNGGHCHSVWAYGKIVPAEEAGVKCHSCGTGV